MSLKEQTITVHVLRSELQILADELKRACHDILKQDISSRLGSETKNQTSQRTDAGVVVTGRGDMQSCTPFTGVVTGESEDSKTRPSSSVSHEISWMKEMKQGSRRMSQNSRLRQSNATNDSLGSSPLSASPRALWVGRHGNSYRKLLRMQDNISSMEDVLEPEWYDEHDYVEINRSRRSLGGFVRRSAEKRFRRHNTLNVADESSCSSNEDERPAGSWLYRNLASCMHTDFCEYVTCFVVSVNAIFIGAETQYMAINWTDQLPEYFHIAERYFCVFFAAEIFLRFCLEGVFAFFCSGMRGGHYGWQWNVFDLSVTCLQAVEFLDFSKRTQELPCFRLLRLTRIFRVFRSIQQLRKLVVSISNAMRSLIWVMVLLLTLIYIVAVFLTLEVTYFKVQKARENDKLDAGEGESYEHMLDWFGTLDRSMLSLHAMVSDGVHWEELMQPLAKLISPWMRLVFFVFSAIAIFAVMNVVTGVFVESVIQRAETYKKHSISRQMRKLFKRADGDGSGDITWDEFDRQVRSPEIQEALLEVDVDVEDARELFRLLDIDGNGTLDIGELQYGSYRLLGQAKAIDLAAVMHELKRLIVMYKEHAQYVEECLSS